MTPFIRQRVVPWVGVVQIPLQISPEMLISFLPEASHSGTGIEE